VPAVSLACSTRLKASASRAILSVVHVPSVTNDDAAEASTPGVSAVTQCHAHAVVICSAPPQLQSTIAAASSSCSGSHQDCKKFTTSRISNTQPILGRSLVLHSPLPYCICEWEEVKSLLVRALQRMAADLLQHCARRAVGVAACQPFDDALLRSPQYCYSQYCNNSQAIATQMIL
jgi:hypothetical protein